MSGSPSCYLFRGNALISEQSWVFGTTGHSNQDKDVCQTGQNWRKTDKSSQIWSEQQKQKHGFICWSFCSLSITFIPTCPSFPKEFTFFKIRVFFRNLSSPLNCLHSAIAPLLFRKEKQIKIIHYSSSHQISQHEHGWQSTPRCKEREIFCILFWFLLIFVVLCLWCVVCTNVRWKPISPSAYLSSFAILILKQCEPVSLINCMALINAHVNIYKLFFSSFY